MEKEPEKKLKMKKRGRRGFSDIECKIWKINIVIVLIAFCIACTVRVVQTDGAHIQGEEDVADADFTSFELTTLDGKEQITEKQLQDYELTVVNFWTTTCIFCIKEMPDLNELSREYKGKVQFIGVCADTRADGEVSESAVKAAQDIVKLRGQAFAQTTPSEDMMGMIRKIPGYPQTYFIDRDGNVVKVISGLKNKDQWKSIVEDALTEVNH